MKKLLTILLLFTMLTASVPFAYGADFVSVTSDDRALLFNEQTGQPFIDENGRTQVPLRQTMEALGFNVSWNHDEYVASVSDDKGTTVYVRIGDNYITKETTNNGLKEASRIKNDTFAQIVNNRTYLPIRIVLEAFGATVDWDNDAKEVRISMKTQDVGALSAEQIYSMLSPSIFYIGLFDRNDNEIRSGSGFFISSDGEAITNYHVIEGVDKAIITTTDGNQYVVDGVLDYNQEYDIARIKIHGNNFPYLEIPQISPRISGGSIVYAIGSPLGLHNTISEGIISNPDRVIDNVSYYQITAPISPGSSGGALFDKYGNIIGITTGGFISGQNLNIALPISNLSKLTGNSLKTLSSLNSNKLVTADFSLSKEKISLNPDESAYIILNYPHANDIEVYYEYHVYDDSIVYAEWGEWYENNINLYLTARNSGHTPIAINLVNTKTDEVLNTKTIGVDVLPRKNSAYYYSGFYPAPDFGKLMGVPVFHEYDSVLGSTFYYSSSYLPNSDFIEQYSAAVLNNGFGYVGSFYNDNGDLVMAYNNSSYGINLLTNCEILNGTACYVVMVLWD